MTGALRVSGLVVVVALTAFALGGAFVHDPLYGALLVAVLGLGVVMLRWPVALSVLALCAVFVVQRAGGSSAAAGSSGGLSYSDLVLAVAATFAFLLVVRSPALERLKLPLLGLGIYLASLVPTLVLHPSTAADLEWAHRLVLVAGALIVGASIARAGATTPALRVLVVVAVVYGALAILAGARHGFSLPAEPLGLNKNFIGAILGVIAALVLCAPGPLALPRTARWGALLVLGGGLLASQSRGSMLAAAIAVYVTVLFSGRVVGRGRQLVALLLALALSYGAYVSVRQQFQEAPAKLQNNSVGVRLSVERETQRIWRTSPIDGVGLKYFRTGEFGYFAQASNNAVDSELAESGVIGAVGFLIMQGMILAAGFRRRREGQLVLVATGLVLATLLHGMIDIYWSAGVTPLPFILLGMALGDPSQRGQMIASARSKTLDHA